MKIGIPKELLNNENRVGIPPSGVDRWAKVGHSATVETEAGLGSGFTADEHANMRASIISTPKEAWASDMIMKVKEPIPSKNDFLKEDQIIFTYFHLASQPELTEVLIDKKIVAIAYETVQLADHSLLLLTPISEFTVYMAF